MENTPLTQEAIIAEIHGINEEIDRIIDGYINACRNKDERQLFDLKVQAYNALPKVRALNDAVLKYLETPVTKPNKTTKKK